MLPQGIGTESHADSLKNLVNIKGEQNQIELAAKLYLKALGFFFGTRRSACK